MKDVTDLSPYAAVVAGSAIRGGKWLPEAISWVEDNRSALARKPFATFMVCITLAMRNADQYRDGVREWMQPIYKLVNPISAGYFAGVLDFRTLPPIPYGMRMRIPAMLGIFPTGDHRDWEAIRAWAEELSELLVAERAG
jgi:menaquinone-dependent protoporphyrinogen oxidase